MEEQTGGRGRVVVGIVWGLEGIDWGRGAVGEYGSGEYRGPPWAAQGSGEHRGPPWVLCGD